VTTTPLSPPSERVAALLRRVPLFEELPPDEIARLAGHLRLLSYPAGALLFVEGDAGDRAYIVLDGAIAIIKSIGTADERLVNIRGEGELIGEMSLLTGDGVRTASARVHQAARLLELTAGDFEALMAAAPALARHLLRVQSRRLREAHDHTIRDLHEKNERLARAYADLQSAQAQIIAQETLLRELRVASEIQQSMLPRALPAAPGFELYARMIPARHVGGDFYDLFPLPGGMVGVAIGDVCGKGVPAALLMALACSLLRAEAVRADDGAPPSPRLTLQRLNRHVRDRAAPGMFVTAIYGVLDPAARSFCYVRAGHEYPRLWLADGAPAHPPRSRAVPIGLLPEAVLDCQTVALPPGSTLLLFSDGVNEAHSPDGELFDYERLGSAASAPAPSAAALCDRIIAAVAAHSGDTPQDDDITLVAIRAL
jgi:serine phosphatase RsbU (regulator of sigma subunit)